MASLALIFRFHGLSALRALRQNAFSLLVVAPIVLGALTAVADRFLPVLAAALGGVLAGESAGPGTIGWTVALLATATGLPAAFDALFPRRGPLLLIDLVPVPAGGRFVATLLARLRGQAGLVVGVWVLALLASRHAGDATAGGPGTWLVRLAGAGLVLTGVELLGVLLLVRARAWRPAVVLVLGAVLAAVALVPGLPRLWLLLPWAVPAAQVSRVLAEASGGGSAAHPAATLLATATAAVVAALASAVASARWQRRVRQSALAQAYGRARRSGRWIDRAAGRLPAAPRALWVRDVLLVSRRFSPAVDVAALAALVLLGLAAAVPALELAPFWRHRVPMLLVALAVLASAALVPFVLRHQLPRAWLERSAGVAPTAIWRAKLWLARALAVPPLVAGGILLALEGPGDAVARLADVATVVVVAWMVASLIGLLSFEIAERPLIGLLFGALVAGAFAALTILYRPLLPAWVAGYLLLAGTVADRATHRVRFTEVAR